MYSFKTAVWATLSISCCLYWILCHGAEWKDLNWKKKKVQDEICLKTKHSYSDFFFRTGSGWCDGVHEQVHEAKMLQCFSFRFLSLHVQNLVIHQSWTTQSVVKMQAEVILNDQVTCYVCVVHDGKESPCVWRLSEEVRPRVHSGIWSSWHGFQAEKMGSCRRDDTSGGKSGWFSVSFYGRRLNPTVLSLNVFFYIAKTRNVLVLNRVGTCSDETDKQK